MISVARLDGRFPAQKFIFKTFNCQNNVMAEVERVQKYCTQVKVRLHY